MYHKRTKAAGPAEAAPTTTTSALVWKAVSSATPIEKAGALQLQAAGADLAYELAFWDTNQATAAWRVLETGTLSDGVPHIATLPRLHQTNGDVFCYVRSTGVTAADVVISAETVPGDADSVVDSLTTLTTAVAAVETAVEALPAESEDVDISATDHTFTITCSALFVGGGGVVTYRLTGDTADHAITVLAGTLLPMKFAKIVRTGTTATGMVGYELA